VAQSQSGAAAAAPDVPSIKPWLLIAVSGFVSLVSLATLVGVWKGAG
jgi:hypothetical protein